MTPRDPLARLAVAFGAFVVVTLAPRPATGAVVFALLLALLLGPARVPLRRILRGLAPFAFFALTSAWIYAVAPDPTYRAIGGTGWDAALLVTVRTFCVGLISLGYVLTTPAAGLARALVHRAGMPRRIVCGTLAAVQFLPGLAEELRMARLVARAALPDPARGGRIVAAVRRWAAGLGPAVIVTLLAGAMRRADTAAIALELRGVAGPGQPTPWRVARFERDDAAFALLSGLALAAVAVLTWH